MIPQPRVLFVDTTERPCWGPQPNRFAGCALSVAEAGFEVMLATIGAQPKPSRPASMPGVRTIGIEPLADPLVCGRGRASETQALRHAYTLAQRVALADYDLVVAPLRAGVAHGLLMQRATGAAPARTRIALWCDAPSRWLSLQEDESPADSAPLVADALERMTLRLADGLVHPGPAALARLTGLGAPPPLVQSDLVIEPRGSRARVSPGRPDEIVVVGPLSRTGGALLVMDALEQLARDGRLGERRVTFVGPMSSTGAHLGQEMIGIRAQSWPFRFRLQPTTDPIAVLRTFEDGAKLAVFAADDADDDRLLREVLATGCAVIATRGYDLTRDGGAGTFGSHVDEAAAMLAAHCGGVGASLVSHSKAAPTWAATLEALLDLPYRSPAECQAETFRKVTVCTATHARRDSLLEAVRSVGPCSCPVEVLVLDNAPENPLAASDLPGEAGHRIRIVRSEKRRSPASAYNHLAAAADGDVLMFLDDDNVLTPGGLDRFAAAMQAGWFDIVVTTLDLVDGNAARDPSAGRFVFLGEAASAGLFFNGFGDRAMAVRRDLFLRLGGFPDPGHHGPVSDWTFLARAQAAGSRIGVLQDPAVRYARRLAGAETNWLKHDLGGARRAVLDAYGDGIDGPFVARFAQGLQSRSF